MGRPWDRVVAALGWRPEWPFVVVAAMAWVALLGGQLVTGAIPPLGHHDETSGFLDPLPGWALMSMAMMLPVTLPAVRHVGMNSLRGRREWAMGLYVVTFVLVWLAFGAVALGADRLARDGLGLDERVVLWHVLAIAAVWELTRFKRRALFACRRTVPLPPRGRRADAGCVRFALVQGRRCVISCWALMLVVAVVGHASVAWMVVVTALILAEELTTMGRRLLRPAAGLLALAAVGVALGI